MNLDPAELAELTRASKASKKLRALVEEADKADEEPPAPRAKWERALNERQEQFCQLMVKYGGDFKRAYEEAGYSIAGKMWEVEAGKLKRLPKIKARVEAIRRGLAKQAGIDENWVLTMGKKFVERAYTLGDTKGGKDVLELIAKILGIMRERDKGSSVPALVQNLNFITGKAEHGDLHRLALAAGVKVVDVESEPMLLEDKKGENGVQSLQEGARGSQDSQEERPDQVGSLQRM